MSFNLHGRSFLKEIRLHTIKAVLVATLGQRNCHDVNRLTSPG